MPLFVGDLHIAFQSFKSTQLLHTKNQFHSHEIHKLFINISFGVHPNNSAAISFIAGLLA